MILRKIFCVGFHKTGTTSLAEYYNLAGMTACHWPTVVAGVDHEATCARLWDDPAGLLRQLQPVIDAFDVHSDVPWPGLVNELVTEFPDALFILSVRDPASWWNSLEAHWALRVRSHTLSPYERAQYRRYLTDVTRPFSRSDRDQLMVAYRQHNEHVRKTVPSERLLDVRIDDPGIAGRLASFAGTNPSVPFPIAQPRPASMVKALRRALRARRNDRRFGPGQ